MKIINKKAIDDFKRLHADSIASINAWVNEAAKAQWKNPMELKSRFPAKIGRASVGKECRSRWSPYH